MCGILAIVSPLVPIERGLLEHMRDQMTHRGPDWAGTWLATDGRVGLGHRRLVIVDASQAANQPLVSADERYRLVYNGEIYNYLELKADLVREGVSFRTRSDTEVLLNALIQWGERALLRLNGMFSFALWDDHRQELLVVRDRFGEKPLFVGQGDLGVLIVASEMKAILQHPQISLAYNDTSIERYGANEWREDDTLTFFASIERVPPGYGILFDAHGRERKRWRYWTPDYDNRLEAISRDESIEQFSYLMRQSVSRRLRADVSIGSSLSGGLDSSVIVAELSKHRELKNFTQNTFTACFPGDETISEEKDVDLVVAATQSNSFKVVPSPVKLAEESMRLHYHQEEPFMSASIYLQWCVARLAKENSTSILLDGQGADELLAGYQSLFPLWQLDLLDRGDLRGAQAETTLFSERLRMTAAKYTNVIRRFDPGIAYSTEELADMQAERPPIWNNGYGEGCAPAILGNRMQRVLSETLLYNGLPMLLRYADRNSMAHSREARLPYLDYDLADFCISLPPNYLIHKGWQKWPLRCHASAILPNEIAWRVDKVGYAAPLDNWLRNELQEWAQDRIFDSSLAKMPGYDRQEIESTWKTHQLGENNSWAIWKWISLSEWLELGRCGYWRAGFA